MGFAKISGTRQYDMMVGSVEAFKELWVGGLKADFKTFTAEDDRVLVEFEGRSTLPNGKPYNNQYVMAFTFKGGKIKQVNEYFCTVLADQVMYPVLQERGLIPT
jgi:ketosteroid isomerase-like protein